MEITSQTIAVAKARFFEQGRTIRYLAPERNTKGLTGNYRMPKIPAKDRYETAMGRVIRELERQEP